MITSCVIQVIVGYNNNTYGPRPVKPRDLKALAAFLAAYAEAPETVDIHLGSFRSFYLKIEVADEV